MLIHNYGLKWDRYLPMKGHRSRGPNINFKDQIGLYVLYKGEEPYYVGLACCGKDPMKRRISYHIAHVKKKGKWDNYSWFGFKPVEGPKLGELGSEPNKSVA